MHARGLLHSVHLAPTLGSEIRGTAEKQCGSSFLQLYPYRIKATSAAHPVNVTLLCNVLAIGVVHDILNMSFE